MRTKNNNAVVGHIVLIVDKDGAALTQILHHKLVVYDFMAHINRGAKNLQRTIYDINGTINPGTEAARICQSNVHYQIPPTDRHIRPVCTAKVPCCGEWQWA